MRIRGRKTPAADHSVSLSSPSFSSSSSSSSITATRTSSITAAHSSSQDSSTSSPFSLFGTTTHRCHGLDLLVKAIHQVSDGSIIGVPYIQRRVTIRRRRRSRTGFDALIFAEFSEQKKRQPNEKKLNNTKKKKQTKGKNSKKVMGLPAKLQDSVLQPWGRRSDGISL